MFQKANITKDQHLEFQDENISGDPAVFWYHL